MSYATDCATRLQIATLCLPSMSDKAYPKVSLAKRIGEIAGVLWSADKTAPDSQTAYRLWKSHRPMNVVAVPEGAQSALPKLEKFESAVIDQPILGKRGDVVFVKVQA